jgi:integrase
MNFSDRELATSMGKSISNRKKIGLALINAMPPETTIWDADLKGFCARRQKSEAVTYMVKMRVNGRIRWFTIGRAGSPWTPDSARKRALQILADPIVGEKPLPPVLTAFDKVADRFIDTYCQKLGAKTREDYERFIKSYLKPTFGKLDVQAITRGDVSNAHIGWKANPRAANYALSVMSRIMTWAEEQEYRTENTNPCRRVERYKEIKRQKFLQPDELARLGAAFEKAGATNLVSPYALAALQLLLLTGARLNEIATLRWEYVDLERRLLFLPTSKTGPKTINLNDSAIAVVKALPRFANNPFLIVGRHGDHLKNLQKPWRAVRKLANLNTVRIHDLRHTYASYGVESGGSLPMLGKQLGHVSPTTTQRYSHLQDKPVRKLNETIGKKLTKAMGATIKK